MRKSSPSVTYRFKFNPIFPKNVPLKSKAIFGFVKAAGGFAPDLSYKENCKRIRRAIQHSVRNTKSLVRVGRGLYMFVKALVS